MDEADKGQMGTMNINDNLFWLFFYSLNKNVCNKQQNCLLWTINCFAYGNLFVFA